MPALCGNVENMPNHLIKVMQQFDCRNPKHPYALRDKPFIPRSIAHRLIPTCMNLAVHLDRKPASSAVEIEHIVTCFMLSAEDMAFGLGPQHTPEPQLRRCHHSTQLPA